MFYLSIKGTCSAQFRVETSCNHLKVKITWDENAPLWIVLSQDGKELARGNSNNEPDFCTDITNDQRNVVNDFLNRELSSKLDVYKKTEELRVIFDQFCDYIKKNRYKVIYLPAGATECYYLAKKCDDETNIVTNYIRIALILLEQCDPIGIYRFPIDIVVDNQV